MANGKKGNPNARLIGALVPLALVELLVSKGVITEDELNKAVAKALVNAYSKRKAIKIKGKTGGGEESGK